MLVNKAEARMTVDAVEKRAFFEKIKAVSLGDDESASLPTVVVHVDGLDVVHETSTKDGAPSTVGTTLWGIASLPYSLGASLFSSRGKVVHRKLILQDVSCVLKPGRLTLLLGPPASGKVRHIDLPFSSVCESSIIPARIALRIATKAGPIHWLVLSCRHPLNRPLCCKASPEKYTRRAT